MKQTRLIFWFTTIMLALTTTASAQFGNRDYDVSLNGQGVLRQAGFNDERVRYVRVTLRRNGRADLQIEGDMPQTNFSGQWTSSGSDAVRVTINSGFGNSNTYGNGTIYFRNSEVTRFEIDGRANGNRFTISFTAQSSSGGYDGGRPGGNAVVELVQNDLYDRIAREKRERIELEFDTADVYSISSRETGVRGTASLRVGSGNFEKIRYDATVDTSSNRINRSTWDFANRYNEDNRNNPPSGAFRAGRYTLQLVNTKRMLAVGNDNVTVQQVSANNSPSQQWDIESAGGGYYYIRLADSNLVMTVEGKADNGSSVIVTQPGRVGQDNQLWEVKPGPDNGYYFINKVRGKALDSPSSARFEGGRMQVYSSNGESNQRFLLREIQVYDRGRDGRAGNRGGGNRGGRAGVLNWRGRVDDTVELEVRGAAVYERVLSGKEISNARSNFTTPLPTRNVTLTLEKKRGRGRIEIVEQPSAANNWTAIIQIVDTSGGAGDYEFDLIWN